MPRTHASSATSQYVGGSVRDARRRRGLTQAELAARLSVSPAYVAAVETGRTNLTVGALASIADALRTGLDISFPDLAAEHEQLDAELAKRSVAVTG